MNNDDNLDLLDLNDDADSTDALPDAAPFAAPRAKKPWLLIAVGVLIIILATYVIIRIVGDDSGSSMEVDLDAPAVIVDGGDPNAPLIVPAPGPQPAGATANVAAPQPVAPGVQPAPQPVVQPAPVPPQPAVQNTTPGVPVRVIEDRKDVTFDPDKAQAAVKPAPAPAATKPATKPAAKPAPKPTAQPARRATQQAQRAQTAPRTFAWYAQIGSYSTRALAESGQRQLRAAHQNLFNGHQFVILAAVLPNGNTAYRLRVGFNAAADANNFCRNAKADGLECYVTK